jgi:hypothetical protein
MPKVSCGGWRWLEKETKKAWIKRLGPSKKMEIDRANEERRWRQCERKRTSRLQLKVVEEEVNMCTKEEVMSEREQRLLGLELALSISMVLIV